MEGFLEKLKTDGVNEHQYRRQLSIVSKAQEMSVVTPSLHIDRWFILSLPVLGLVPSVLFHYVAPCIDPSFGQ